jgi:signal transduction histidine kinase
LKQLDPKAYLPVVAVVDARSIRHQTSLNGCEADDILTRPVEPALLVMRIRALLAIRSRFETLQRQSQRIARELAETRRMLDSYDLIKQTLISNVGHEMRTPLLQVKSAVALLREDIAPDAANFPLIQMAVEATGRLHSLVDNLTQLGEVENFALEPVQLDESVDLAIRNLERLWKLHDTRRIKKRYSRKLPPVLGDKRGIPRLLQNLLDNALKFDPEGGLVEILIQPSADGLVWIGVRDCGIGIPEDKIAHVFEAFYQVDPSSSRKFPGAGVGLALARLLASGMNTQIEVQSAPGQGSTFSFALPAVDLQIRRAAPAI